MTDLLFPAPPVHTIPVEGESAAFPIHRIFCVGRNYAAHAAEMGNTPDYEAPFYFTKSPAHAIGSGANIPYPLETSNYRPFVLKLKAKPGIKDEIIAKYIGLDEKLIGIVITELQSMQLINEHGSLSEKGKFIIVTTTLI